MAYSATDIVNLQSDIKDLKAIHDKFISLNHELCAALVRVEYFLEHYHDYKIEEDDLPIS